MKAYKKSVKLLLLVPLLASSLCYSTTRNAQPSWLTVFNAAMQYAQSNYAEARWFYRDALVSLANGVPIYANYNLRIKQAVNRINTARNLADAAIIAAEKYRQENPDDQLHSYRIGQASSLLEIIDSFAATVAAAGNSDPNSPYRRLSTNMNNNNTYEAFEFIEEELENGIVVRYFPLTGALQVFGPTSWYYERHSDGSATVKSSAYADIVRVSRNGTCLSGCTAGMYGATVIFLGEGSQGTLGDYIGVMLGDPNGPDTATQIFLQQQYQWDKAEADNPLEPGEEP